MNNSNGSTMPSTTTRKKKSSWIPITPSDSSSNSNENRIVEGVDEDGWFTETEAMWPGQKFALALEVSASVRGWLYADGV